MKGLILSGGAGTRLRPITHTNAKQLVPVANKPILYYGIEALRDAGITDIGIVVGETRKEIENATKDCKSWGVNISYIYQEKPLGLAHAVKVSKDFIGDSSFVMYLGDNVIRDGICSLVREFEEDRPNAQILLASVANPKQFGVAELDPKTGSVIKLEEKPQKPKSDLALVGVYMFDKNIMKAVEQIKPSARGEFEITDAIQWLIDHKFDVRSHVIKGWWKDTGKLDDMLEANRMMLDDVETRLDGEIDQASSVHFKVVVEKGAKVINSTIRGPAVIGPGTIIQNSYVGPYTSIYYDCKIIDSEVEHSIILECSTIEKIDKRITDSLIGRNVRVAKSPQKPNAYRFMLGDNSEVGILI